MIPVVTIDEMRAIDEAAHRAGRLDELVARAGWAVALGAYRMLGGTYGRRVAVVAGRGNNGADGRVAARHLAGWGARVRMLDASDAPCELSGIDLVIDAAFGTGFRGQYRAPAVCSPARVLAVDIPSGVDGSTGIACEGAATADATVTFAAFKPGLLLGDGPSRAGRITLADIGLDVSSASAHLLEASDVAVGARPRTAHKWSSAVWVVAGSAGMMGAASLTSRAAMRAGSGTVRLGVPGASPAELPVSEVVARCLPAEGWEAEVAAEITRCRALVVGPGLGRAPATSESVRALVATCPVPVVVDADGIYAFPGPGDLARAVAALPDRAVIITPHDGEFERLSGSAPGPDRLESVRALARSTGAIVLLKGPTTVVASPGGRVLISDAGTPSLATAGTGDVLTGVIAAFLARGVDPLEAAGYAAYVHGRAARSARDGLLAGDLVDLIPRWLDRRSRTVARPPDRPVHRSPRSAGSRAVSPDG